MLAFFYLFCWVHSTAFADLMDEKSSDQLEKTGRMPVYLNSAACRFWQFHIVLVILSNGKMLRQNDMSYMPTYSCHVGTFLQYYILCHFLLHLPWCHCLRLQSSQHFSSGWHKVLMLLFILFLLPLRAAWLSVLNCTTTIFMPSAALTGHLT